MLIFLILCLAGTISSPTQITTDKLELAKRLASRINMAKNLGAEAKGATQQAAEAILKGGGSQPIITVSLLIITKHDKVPDPIELG